MHAACVTWPMLTTMQHTAFDHGSMSFPHKLVVDAPPGGVVFRIDPVQSSGIASPCRKLRAAARGGLRPIDKSAQVVGEQLSDRLRWIVAFRWGKRHRRLTRQPSGRCFPKSA